MLSPQTLFTCGFRCQAPSSQVVFRAEPTGAAHHERVPVPKLNHRLCVTSALCPYAALHKTLAATHGPSEQRRGSAATAACHGGGLQGHPPILSLRLPLCNGPWHPDCGANAFESRVDEPPCPFSPR